MAQYSEKLARRVTERMRQLGLSSRQVAMRSEGKLSYTAVNDMSRGQPYSPNKLVALALTLGDDPDEYLEAANTHFKYFGPRDLASVMLASAAR